MLLVVMVILGLIIVFPQSLDLLDMILAENSSQQETSLYSDKYPQKKNVVKKEQGFFYFLARNVAPSIDDVKTYLLQRPDTTDIICISEIPKITFDEKSAKISPLRPFFNIQIITRTLAIPRLKTGTIYLQPKIDYIGSGMPIAQWFSSNTLEGWRYKIKITKEELLSQTRYSTITKNKLKHCD
jgi:hypothetical protein